MEEEHIKKKIAFSLIRKLGDLVFGTRSRSEKRRQPPLVSFSFFVEMRIKIDLQRHLFGTLSKGGFI